MAFLRLSLHPGFPHSTSSSSHLKKNKFVWVAGVQGLESLCAAFSRELDQKQEPALPPEMQAVSQVVVFAVTVPTSKAAFIFC